MAPLEQILQEITAFENQLSRRSFIKAALLLVALPNNTLGKEEQEVIRAAAKESVPYMRQLWDEREAKARATVEAAGATIITDIDRQGFVDAAKPVYDKFAADPKLQDLIKQVQATE